MRRTETITVTLEEHEIDALRMLNRVVCPTSIFGNCSKCPFHLDTNILLSSGYLTACFSIVCGDILRKDKEKMCNDQGN